MKMCCTQPAIVFRIIATWPLMYPVVVTPVCGVVGHSFRIVVATHLSTDLWVTLFSAVAATHLSDLCRPKFGLIFKVCFT